jgi:hypothetical protein
MRCAYLVVKKHRAARLEQVLVHKGHDGDVVLGADRRSHDGVVLVDPLFERTHAHGRTAQLIDLGALLLRLLFLWLQHLLVLFKFFLHQEPVLDPLELQQTQAAFRVWRDCKDGN